MVAYVCNPSSQEVRALRQKDCKFEASLGYIGRTCRKRKKKRREGRKKK
jgi:hypothetical protein